MELLLGVALFGSGLAASLVVTTRNPAKQALMLSLLGLMLTVAFVLLMAPVVALSQVVVSASLVPALVFLALAKTEGGAE